MDLLELKKLLRKITVKYGYEIKENNLGPYDAGDYCEINKGHEIDEFLTIIEDLRQKVIEELLSSNSVSMAQWISSEYEILQNQFSTFELEGNIYLRYNNLRILFDESFYLIPGESIAKHKFSEKKQKEVDRYLERTKSVKNKDILQMEYLRLIDDTVVTEITQLKLAIKVDQISSFIKETLNYIDHNIKLHFGQEVANEANKKELDRLNVKQQILILHYLFTFYQNSEAEIPNNRLSQLLGSILGRNSETIRSLLTYMLRVEDNETDDKIAKTPKNLTAVFELFNALKLQPLQLLVERDIDKMKKITK